MASLQVRSRLLAQVFRRRQAQGSHAQGRGDDNPLPTRTPIAQIIGAYVDHIRAIKTARSAQNDIYYLREAFGPVCEQLTAIPAWRMN